MTGGWWQVTGDLRKITEAQAEPCQRCLYLAKIQTKSHHKKRAGHVQEEMSKTGDCSQCSANWTVQQLGTRSKPIKASQNSTLDWNYCGSDYLSAKLPKTKAKLMLQWWSGYQGFPGLKASHEHADDWAPASERRTKLQMKETHHCKTVQQRLASYYLKPS